MKKYLLLFLICPVFYSCASLLNGDRTAVAIYTEKPAEVIFQRDTLHTELKNGFNAVRFEVLRSKDSLRFVLLSDSLRKEVSIPSKTSWVYYLNAYLIWWPGLIIDWSSPRKYTYSKALNFNDSLCLDMNKKLTTAQRKDLAGRKIRQNNNYFVPRKGDLYWNLSFPMIYLTLGTIAPEGFSRQTKGSVLGIATGFDYYYKEDKFFNLSGSIGLYSPTIGCGESGAGHIYDRESSVDDGFNIYNLNISHNHKTRYFSFGYGLSYSYIDWHKDTYSRVSGYYYPEPKKDYLRYSLYNDYPYRHHREEARYSMLGLVLNGYCYLSRNFTAGIIYKPNFVRLKSNTGNSFSYEHQITLDFAFKFNLLKGK